MRASKKNYLAARVLLGTALFGSSANAVGDVVPQRWSPYQVEKSLSPNISELALTGADIKSLWNILAPHLEDATLVIEKENRHRRVYRIFWENRWIYGAKLHTYENNTQPLLNGAWPDKTPACTALQINDSLPSQSEKVWWIGAHSCQDAYTVPTRKEILVLARDTHEILSRDPIDFHVTAHVHTENVLDAKLQTVTLDEIKEGDYLDYPMFSVFGRTTLDTRAQAMNGLFPYTPDSNPTLFDQVQTSFNAQKALSWFQRMTGWEHSGRPIEIFTNTDDLNNAFYLPAQGTLPAEVHLGRGDQISMRFLSRDADVVSHELSHHYIYQFVTTSRGDSGVIHEGTADYLAYAIQGDPHLGETVVPNAPYLRTALISENRRYDDPNQDRTSHHLGQYWSAVLWDLREQLGSEGDEMILTSLSYLPEQATLTDAFVALLYADNALFPTTDKYRGENYCTILKRAIARGFTHAVRSLDGSSCELDLAQIASQRDAEIVPPQKSSRDPLAHIIPACGALSHGGKSFRWFALLCLGFPFLPLLFGRRREHT